MTDRFIKMCDVYKIFAQDWNCDFSDAAKQEMYDYETYGKGNLDNVIFGSKPNGYAVGKKWLNVTVSMWLEDMVKRPFMQIPWILYQDDKFPKWWLDKIFKR